MKKIFTFLVLCAFLTQNFVFFSEVKANDDVAPVFEKISVSSNNANQRYAKVGDEITITLRINPEDTWKEGNNVTVKIGETEIGTIRNFSKSDNPKAFGNIKYTIKDGENGKFSFKDLVFQDASGNEITGFTSDYNPQDEDNVTVDTTAPTVEFTEDVDSNFSSSDTVNITVTETNLKEIKYGFSDDATCDVNDTYNQDFDSGVAFNLTTKDNNGKYICVKAEDEAGNISYKNSASAIKINNIPTDISLTNNSVDENSPVGTVIGTLSTTDADNSDTHTYEFADGGVDNSSFSIEGNELKTNSDLDFETKTSYSIKIKSVDNSGESFEKDFTITVNDIDDTAPVFSSIEVTSTKTEKNGKKYLKQGDSFDIVLNIDPEDTWLENNIKLFIGDNEIKTLNFEKSDSDNKKSKPLTYTVEANQNGEISFKDLYFKDESENVITGFTSPYEIENFVIDTVVEKPVIGNLPEYINSKTQNLEITGTCETGSMLNFEFTSLKSNETISTTSTTCDNLTFSLNLPKMELDKFEEGDVTIKVKQIDLAENESEFSELKTIKKDTIAPTISLEDVKVKNGLNGEGVSFDNNKLTLKLGNGVSFDVFKILIKDNLDANYLNDLTKIRLNNSEINSNIIEISTVSTTNLFISEEIKDLAGNSVDSLALQIKIEENDKTELNEEIKKAEARINASNVINDDLKKDLQKAIDEAKKLSADANALDKDIKAILPKLKGYLSHGFAPNPASLVVPTDSRVFTNGEKPKTEETKEEPKKVEPKKEEIIESQIEKVKKALEKQNKELREINIGGQKRFYSVSKNYGTCPMIPNILGDYNKDFEIDYKDLGNIKNLDEVQRLAKTDVVNPAGVNNTNLFEPNRGITRAEFLAIVLKVHCYDVSKPALSLPYKDVNLNTWQARVIQVANRIGIIRGYEDGSFQPNREISKIEAFGIMMKMREVTILGDYKDRYTDKKADWQAKPLSAGEYLGIINPETSNFEFKPNSSLNRDEMVKLIVDIIRLY